MPDFRAVFESAPSPLLLLLPDDPLFTINAASDTYLRVTGLTREEVLGRGVFDIFPDNPNDPASSVARDLRASLRRAIASCAPDALLWQRYEIRRPAPEAVFVERYWNTLNTPILGPDGHLQYVLHSVEDVTDKMRTARSDAFLVQLDNALRSLTNPDEIVRTATRVLGEYLHADRCVYCVFEADEDTFEITSASLRPGVPPMAGRHRLTHFGAEAAEMFWATQPIVLNDIESDPLPPDARMAYRRAGIRSHASVPLHKAGRLVAAMGFHQLTPRHWRADEIELVSLVANRCWESFERARVESELRQQWHTFDAALSHTLDFIYTFDREGRFTYANTALLALWQKPLAEAVGRNFFELDYPPELAARLQLQIQQVIDTKEPVRDHTLFTGTTGVTRDYEYIFAPVLGTDGQVNLVAGSTRDMTERQQAEERLRASLMDREVLLQEVHHRVKNNLQVIISLLDLQSDQITDPALLSAFQETQNRVRAIAGIHESLYRSPDLAHIQFGFYLEQLVRDLFSVYGVQDDHIQSKMVLENVVLDIKQATPLGLILNELVTNSLKYAFPDERSGCIGIELSRGDEGWAQLRVWDDGQGLPAQFDPRACDSMGLKLVRILTRQLHGRLHWSGTSGTEFRIEFPLLVTAPKEATAAHAG